MLFSKGSYPNAMTLQAYVQQFYSYNLAFGIPISRPYLFISKVPNNWNPIKVFTLGGVGVDTALVEIYIQLAGITALRSKLLSGAENQEFGYERSQFIRISRPFVAKFNNYTFETERNG